MAITTYSELQTAIANWLTRSDLTTRIPEFITLAEARINRWLRVSALEKRATADTVAGEAYLALPNDYASIKSVRITGDTGGVLERVTADYGHKAFPQTTTGKPGFFAVIGHELALFSTPDSAYTLEIIYYSKPAALSASNTSNWTLENAPDLLLYASLIEAAQVTKDNDLLLRAKGFYDNARADVEAEQERDFWAATPLITRAV